MNLRLHFEISGRRPALALAQARPFAEITRVLRPGGQAAVLEQLRDAPNFAAFGPGFLHFFSERTWLRAAGLALRHIEHVTPFVRLFLFARPL